MHSSPFSVAGMSSSSSTHHNPNLNSWGTSSTSGALAPSFGDSLSQSRSHYQSGYLMSASQNNNVPQGNQRVDEVPVVQTKAKMNQILSRGSTTDFGMDSMFQSSRQRQTLDEDAPPMSSVNDIPNEINLEHSSGRFQPRKAGLETSQFSSSRRNAPVPSNTPQQPVYIIVFGYPPDRYSVTVEYFKSLGNATDADPNTEIANCFKIGYHDAGDAMRAVRKNGEILGGSFMVGAKWADPAQADALVGQPSLRSPFSASISHAQNLSQSYADSPSNSNSGFSSPINGNSMAVDDPFPSPNSNPYANANSNVGTPIKLVPSASAFRKVNASGLPSSKPGTPQSKAWGSGIGPSASAPGLGSMNGIQNTSLAGGAMQTPPQPSKSMMGQVSDLIFGW